MPSRRDDPVQKVNFGDSKWVWIPAAGAAGEVGGEEGTHGMPLGPDAPVYLALSLRNVGNGIAVMHGWHFYPDWYRDDEHAPLEDFQRQTRDLYIPVGDIGFWQGAFRDATDPRYEVARKTIEARQPWTVELLYGDHEGGQRCVSRFTILPREHESSVDPAEPATKPEVKKSWAATLSRHWNIDRPDPR
jgi:hypothetical protein